MEIIMTFNRHTQMSEKTREEILDIIFDLRMLDDVNPNRLINYLFGFFDGYDYSDLILGDTVLVILKSIGEHGLVDRIEAVALTVKGYEKN